MCDAGIVNLSAPCKYTHLEKCPAMSLHSKISQLLDVKRIGGCVPKMTKLIPTHVS